jgi:hypothetical protein
MKSKKRGFSLMNMEKKSKKLFHQNNSNCSNSSKNIKRTLRRKKMRKRRKREQNDTRIPPTTLLVVVQEVEADQIETVMVMVMAEAKAEIMTAMILLSHLTREILELREKVTKLKEETLKDPDTTSTRQTGRKLYLKEILELQVLLTMTLRQPLKEQMLTVAI